MSARITEVGDFDGDGVVVRAEIVAYDANPANPAIRFTFNSGNHQTTVEMGEADLAEMAGLVGDAYGALRALSQVGARR